MTLGLVGSPNNAEPSEPSPIAESDEVAASPEIADVAEAAEPAAPVGRTEPAAPVDVTPPAVPSGSRFWVWMLGVGVVAVGIQALFIHATSHRVALWSGARYITGQATAVVRGAWFIEPGTYTHGHVVTALHPPLPTLLFAVADAASIVGSTPHRVFLALLFVLSVGLAGMTVRALAGDRAGILSALVFATFPLLWVNPATLGPETTVIAVTSLLLFTSVRFWNQPAVKNAAAVGLALGLAALTRTDLVGLVVVLALPLVLLVPNTSWLGRLRYAGVIVALLVVVAAPWVIRNQVVIGHSAVLSEDYGPVLAGANCKDTGIGPLEGWWTARCVATVPTSGSSETKATRADVHAAHAYFSAHSGSAVGLAAVRLGRLWNVYRPLQGVQLEAAVGRPAWVSRLGLWYFYILVPVAVAGAVILRRRRTLVFPFVSMILLSSITAVLAYGDARFALEADVAMAMLAGVALDAAIRTGRTGRTGHTGHTGHGGHAGRTLLARNPGRHRAGRQEEIA